MTLLTLTRVCFLRFAWRIRVPARASQANNRAIIRAALRCFQNVANKRRLRKRIFGLEPTAGALTATAFISYNTKNILKFCQHSADSVFASFYRCLLASPTYNASLPNLCNRIKRTWFFWRIGSRNRCVSGALFGVSILLVNACQCKFVRDAFIFMPATLLACLNWARARLQSSWTAGIFFHGCP